MKHILTKQAEQRGMITIYTSLAILGVFAALWCNKPKPPVNDFVVVHKIDTLHSALPRIRYAKDY